MKHTLAILILTASVAMGELTNTTLDGVTNATVNGVLDDNPSASRTALELGTAATAASTAFAPSALLSPSTFPASAIIWRDDCSGNSQLHWHNSIRAATPGIVSWLFRSNLTTSQSVARHERGELLLTPTLSTVSGFYANAPVTLAAGMTFIVRVVPGVERHQAGDLRIAMGGGGNSSSHGAIVIGGHPENFHGIAVSAGTGSNLRAGYQAVNEGEEISVAIHHKTLSHQQYYMQGGRYSSLGCVVGSAKWFLINETFDTLSGSSYPQIYAQFLGVHKIREMTLLRSWSPGNDSVCHEAKNNIAGVPVKGIHVPYLQKDPVSGLVVQAWNSGVAHYGAAANIDIKYSTRLADGSWTAAAILLADTGGNVGHQFCHLSVVNGKLWLVYIPVDWSLTSIEGGVITRREVTVNATTGEATIGSAVSLFGTSAISFSEIVQTDTGRYVMPYQTEANNDTRPRFAYSDDDGATWTTVPTGTGINPGSAAYFAEQTITKEANGALGAYIRTADNAWYTRSTDNGTTWSQPVVRTEIPMPGSQGARLNARNLADGSGAVLVGNDHQFQRRNITLWKVDLNGNVVWKKSLGELTDAEYPVTETANYTQMQYPNVLFDDSENMLMAISLLHGSNTLDTFNSMRVFTMKSPLRTWAAELTNAAPASLPEWNDGRSPVAQELPYRAEGIFRIPILPIAGTTFTLGATTYTWRSSVGATTNEVLIGADVAACILAARSAINDDTFYQSLYGSATSVNTDAAAIAYSREDNMLRVRAASTGSAGYSVATSPQKVGSGIAMAPFWGATTLQLPEMNLSVRNKFSVTLTGNAIVGEPVAKNQWDEITLVFVQGGAGSFTATFNAIFEFGGITPTWRTAVSATNTLNAYYNPITAKWVVTAWN